MLTATDVLTPLQVYNLGIQLDRSAMYIVQTTKFQDRAPWFTIFEPIFKTVLVVKVSHALPCSGNTFFDEIRLIQTCFIDFTSIVHPRHRSVFPLTWLWACVQPHGCA